MDIICKVCGESEFNNEGGFFFCKECNTQSQEIREEAYDTEERPIGERLNTTKIPTSNSSAQESEIKWTSWEGYNFILIGLVNELIDLGAPPNIKFTCLQLWSAYLRKLEVAFTSTTAPELPKLSILFKKTDVETVYKRKRIKRRRVRSGSRASSSHETDVSDETVTDNNQSIRDKIAVSRQKAKGKRALVREEYEAEIASTSSQFTPYSSETYSSGSSATTESIPLSFTSHAIEYCQSRFSSKFVNENVENPIRISSTAISTYASSPYNLSQYRLYGILYLSLLLNKSDIQLGDMIRFIREGHLSYQYVKHFFPEEMAMCERYMKNFQKKPRRFTHSWLRSQARDLAKFIGVECWPLPDMEKLCGRFVKELQLPDEIMEIISGILHSTKVIQMPVFQLIPSYEARAMGLILFVLKSIFGVDDSTELHLSKLSSKLNEFLPIKSFNWNRWIEFIEWRKILIAEYHYPTRHHFFPDYMDGSAHLLTTHWNKQASKYDYIPETQHNTHLFMFQNFFKKLNLYSDLNHPGMINFPHSLTPYTSYFETIVNTIDLYHQFDDDFTKQSIMFAFKPKQFIKKYKLDNTELVQTRLQNSEILEPVEISYGCNDQLVVIGPKDNKPEEKCKKVKYRKSDFVPDSNKLVFVKASSFYWLNFFAAKIGLVTSEEIFKNIEKEFPKSFRWLLNTVSEMIESETRHVYAELLVVEGFLRSQGSEELLEFEDLSTCENIQEFGKRYW